jgi:hypothetical protein
MTWIAVETVGDDAAAQVLAEALAAHEIPTQRRVVPGTPYGPARLQIEVRVPAERAQAARAVLAFVAQEASAAALRDAPRADEPAPAEPALPEARRTPRLTLLLTAALLCALLDYILHHR